ncbi:MAG: ABC transporter substrate-binding protein [Bacteroidota bacterium]
MIKNTLCLFLVGILLLTSCNQTPTADQDTQTESDLRIISLSGFLTETLFSLGYGDNIIGADITSTYPAAMDSVPRLGHVAQLNAEAILAMKPDFIFVESGQVAQAKALDQIRAANLTIVEVPTSYTFDNSVKAAKVIAESLETDETIIQELASTIESDSLELASMLEGLEERPSVLFIYARGLGRLMISGTGTSTTEMVNRAGGELAISSFEGYQALTPESLVEASPEVILMFESGLASLDGKEGLSQITGMEQIPAYKNGRIITMDGHYLSSFGPRVGKAAIELASKLKESM